MAHKIRGAPENGRLLCGAVTEECNQHLFSSRNTKEAGALSECLVSDFGNFFYLGAALEFAVFLSEFNYIFCSGRVDSRNVGEKRVGSGIDVNTYAVYAVLNDSAERIGKARLLHIVLILTDADCFGLDFNKLGKGVLNSSRNRDCASLHFIILGKLLGSEL